jgi:hypothetical protein
VFGVTTGDNPYVHLSDGGNVDSLGLYEMVLRRCRYIVVSDATLDPGYTFGELARAVRRINHDLGIPITFSEGVRIDASHHLAGNAHHGVGIIGYSTVDGDVADGVLIYLKAAVSGDEPMDVLNYAKTEHAFPHESTLESPFSQDQFDSYRGLGLHSVQAIASELTRLLEPPRAPTRHSHSDEGSSDQPGGTVTAK